MSIPASALVSVTPSVLGAAGAALDLNGLILTADTAVPIGAILPFSSAAAVSAFFGGSSTEAALSAIYFAGFTNGTATPGRLLFAQYNTAAVSAYLRGGVGVTLAQVQSITSGTLSVTVDGVVETTSALNLSAETSLSNAAAAITAAFTTGPIVTYDSQRGAFVVTSTTTGATSTIGFASGSPAAILRLTAATGAVTSQGAAAAVPGALMDSVVNASLNWAAFMTTVEPSASDQIAFATWNSQQNNRFIYVAWDTDPNATVAGNTTALGPQLAALSLSGTIPVTADSVYAAQIGVTTASLAQPLAAGVLGYVASLDFARLNARTTLAYRAFSGVAAGVQDQTVADNLKANGYNFYGAYATAPATSVLCQPGQISGPFAWADSYANQIKLNADLQAALLAFLQSAGSVPYNNFGYSAIESACLDPITRALDFGTIRTNVQLSAAQITAVNASAGRPIAATLQTRGWYLLVRDPGAAVRAARGTPQMTFYYCDGGSIQELNLASIAVQ